jgi:predicted PurR-regulated permease PerM
VFLAAVIDPGVQWLENELRVPRAIAVLIHYFIALFVILFLFISLIPIIAAQLQQIAVFLSTEVDAFLANPQIEIPLVSMDTNIRLTSLAQGTLQTLSINEFTDALAQFGQNLSTAAQGGVRYIAQLAGSVVGFFISFIIVLVLSMFIQLEKEGIVQWIRSLFPQKFRTYLDHKSEAVHTKIGQWARGQLLLMLSIFALTLIALIILRMPYALTLAVLAGFCEFIPAVGPFIAAVPAVLIAFTQEGFIWGLVLAGVYYVIQWCENNLLVPLIMKRAVGLSPIAILFAMMVGVSFPATLHPILGVMLAVPTTTILTIFLEDIRDRKE